MRPHIGNASHLKKALHGAVLTVFAVKHRKHHIDGGCIYGIALEAQQALTPDGRNRRRAVVRVCDPGFGGQHGIVRAAEVDPLPRLGDAHGQDMVFFLVNMVQNGFRRTQGDLMLRADTAEQDANR